MIGSVVIVGVIAGVLVALTLAGVVAIALYLEWRYGPRS